jgi:hypothetical protein
MDDYTISLMVEREKRRFLAQKMIAWENENGIQFMPIKPDVKKTRIEQLVDEALFMDALKKK